VGSSEGHKLGLDDGTVVGTNVGLRDGHMEGLIDG